MVIQTGIVTTNNLSSSISNNTTYTFNSGDGKVTVPTTAGYTTLDFSGNISLEELAFSKSNNNLVIKVLGTNDQITLTNWYFNQSRMIDTFNVGSSISFGNAYINDWINHNYNIIIGKNNGDFITGTNKNDYILAGNGKNTILCQNGNDVVYGGDNTNFIVAGNGNDELHGGAKSDTIIAGNGTDFVYGEAGNDVIIGGSGRDVLDGGNGNDTIVAGTGAGSQLMGESGSDTYLFRNKSYGQQYIYDDNNYAARNDVIEFTNGVNQKNVEFDASGNDLNIVNKNNGSTITVEQWVPVKDIGVTGVGKVIFNDGSSLTASQINKLVQGKTITANSTTTQITGTFANDTYIFNGGINLNTVINNPGGSDTIKFGSNVSKKQIAVFIDPTTKELEIDYGNNKYKDEITFTGNGDAAISQIGKIVASDKTFITNSDINKIVQDMTAFAASHHISLTSVESVKDNTSLMNIINTAWHA